MFFFKVKYLFILCFLDKFLGAKKTVTNDVAKVWTLSAQDVNDDDLVSLMKQ